MSTIGSIGNAKFFEKKIKKNARYDHVKSRLDTGCSRSKYNDRMEEIRRNYKYQKDELFKRLDVTTFAKLALQVASVSEQAENELDGDPQGGDDGLSLGSSAELECASELANGSTGTSPSLDRGHEESATSCNTARSTLLSVISGVSELSLNREPPKTKEPTDGSYPDCPYLLLDVRDRDDYDRCHMISAHSFPITMLSRVVNPYIKEVLDYKNALERIIILYDEDERIAIQAATAMCQRGFDNLFMLSGGLKVLAQKFPRGLTTGSFPPSCLSSSTRTKRRPAMQQQQQHPQQGAETRWRFTTDELVTIQNQLMQNLSLASSTQSDRRSTTRSRKSSLDRLSQRSQSSRPWK